MYLIQGCFFQQQEYLGLQCVPIQGTIAVLRRGLFQTMYAGIISGEGTAGSRKCFGEIADHYGQSMLTEIVIQEHRFRFTKKYLKRSDEIYYTFEKRQENTWAGEYSGKLVGTGVSRCVLTQVPDNFMDPIALVKILGLNVPHVWSVEMPG